MFLPLIVWAVIFISAYTQSPLFTSNQNQYFLHGIAASGFGFLYQDWLVNTFDPTPVFSAFVQVVARSLPTWFFYLVAGFLIGLYFWLLVKIVSETINHSLSTTEQALFFSILVVVHSAAWRFALSRLLGANWSYVLEDGLADQRLLGPVLQPSMFGVLLLLSIWLFLKNRPYLAVIASGAAATIHPTYLLSAAALTLAYLLTMLLEPASPGQHYRPARDRLRNLLGVGLTAFLAVLPIVAYTYLTFGSAPAETAAEARHILVNYRIPHHVQPEIWFDATALVKLAILLAAIWLARKTRLFLVLLVPAILALALSLLYVLTRSNFLGLLFPWRVSTFLVPISSALLIHWLVQTLSRSPRWQSTRFQLSLRVLAYTITALAMLVGLTRLVLDFQRQANAPEQPLVSYVRNHLAPGQVVLTPIKLQEFRLATGSPVFVDFKSIPYRDLDVLEWYRRVRLADEFYKMPTCSGLLTLLQTEDLTHAVLPAGMLEDGCHFLTLEFRTPAYRYYSWH